jgi:hypothetical protein
MTYLVGHCPNLTHTDTHICTRIGNSLGALHRLFTGSLGLRREWERRDQRCVLLLQFALDCSRPGLLPGPWRWILSRKPEWATRVSLARSEIMLIWEMSSLDYCVLQEDFLCYLQWGLNQPGMTFVDECGGYTDGSFISKQTKLVGSLAFHFWQPLVILVLSHILLVFLQLLLA